MTGPRITLRQWLTRRLLLAGADIFTTAEAVASTALKHPEWDMDKLRTWDQWEGATADQDRHGGGS